MDRVGDHPGSPHHPMESSKPIPMQMRTNAVSNQRQTILKDIAHIQLTALTYLDLRENLIESIEGISRLHMPHIGSLILSTWGEMQTTTEFVGGEA